MLSRTHAALYGHWLHTNGIQEHLYHPHDQRPGEGVCIGHFLNTGRHTEDFIPISFHYFSLLEWFLQAAQRRHAWILWLLELTEARNCCPQILTNSLSLSEHPWGISWLLCLFPETHPCWSVLRCSRLSVCLRVRKEHPWASMLCGYRASRGHVEPEINHGSNQLQEQGWRTILEGWNKMWHVTSTNKEVRDRSKWP